MESPGRGREPFTPMVQVEVLRALHPPQGQVPSVRFHAMVPDISNHPPEGGWEGKESGTKSKSEGRLNVRLWIVGGTGCQWALPRPSRDAPSPPSLRDGQGALLSQPGTPLNPLTLPFPPLHPAPSGWVKVTLDFDGS